MDVMQQILKIGIDASLGVYRSLFTSKQVIKLNNSDRDSLILLGLHQKLSQLNIFDQFIANCAVKV
jgi:hypothetical protein